MLAAEYAADLTSRSDDELRAMKSECSQLEHSISYYRRIAQGRLEILDAERARRSRGGTIEELIADLPQILGSEGARPAAAHARYADPEVEVVDLGFDERERALVDGDTLAQLPRLDGRQLDESVDGLRTFERELSSSRHLLHGVIDALERELATRQATGAR